MFEHVKRQADQVRAKEKLIYEDYKNGLTIREILSKHSCVGAYVIAVVKYIEREGN